MRICKHHEHAIFNISLFIFEMLKNQNSEDIVRKSGQFMRHIEILKSIVISQQPAQIRPIRGWSHDG